MQETRSMVNPGEFPTVAAGMSDDELEARLAFIGETGDHALEGVAKAPQESSETAAYVAKGFSDVASRLLHREPPIWKSNAHAFGYVSPSSQGGTASEIIDVGEIEPDLSLKDARVNVTLNVLRVKEYPGHGTHRILFDFYAQNQTSEGSEEIHYNATHRVLDGERAGVRGAPIFVGLGVGSEGIGIRCYTVNVKNDDDERLLDILDSAVFKKGLQLATGLQPVLAPFASMAAGLTKTLASKNKNIPVQDIWLGLDFNRVPGGARLAEGAYVMIQIPERDRSLWDWTEWVFNRNNGQISHRLDPNRLVPYNYIVIGISKYCGQ